MKEQKGFRTFSDFYPMGDWRLWWDMLTGKQKF